MQRLNKFIASSGFCSRRKADEYIENGDVVVNGRIIKELGYAIKGKVDPLYGLKENVIIGKLIPAGTGMKRYRDVKIDTMREKTNAVLEDDLNEAFEAEVDNDEFDDVEYVEETVADEE